MQTFSFETALELVKAGHKVARSGWKNAGFIFLVEGSTFAVNRAPLNTVFKKNAKVTYRPHIDMVGTDGRVGTWSPSSVDIFATDWHLHA